MHQRIRLAARAVASLLLAAAIATSATACGDGDNGRSQSADEFKADFVKASASYKQATENLKAQAKTTVGQDAGQAGMLTVYEQMRTFVVDARRQYGELDAPSGVEDEFKDLLSALDGQKKALDTVLASASSSNAAELTTSLGDLARLLGEFAQLHQKIESELKD